MNENEQHSENVDTASATAAAAEQGLLFTDDVSPLPSDTGYRGPTACNAAGGMEVIWASCRELLNIMQADQIGCHVITVPADILKKLGTVGRDLGEYSLDTVQTFYKDGAAAGFSL